MKIGLLNVWLLFIPAYAIIWLTMIVVNSKRSRPIEDPELMKSNRKEQLLFGFYPHLLVTIITIFIPLTFGRNFIPGVVLFVMGVILCLVGLISFSSDVALNTKGIYRFSRNPMYSGMFLLAAGLCIASFALSFASFLFIAVAILWILATHRIVKGEEKFLEAKYGETYKYYKSRTARYFGLPKSVE